MTRQDGPYFDENYLRQGSPTNSTFAESYPRMHVTGNCVSGATGIMTSIALPLQYGDVVTNLTFISGTTAAGTPTVSDASLEWAKTILGVGDEVGKIDQVRQALANSADGN